MLEIDLSDFYEDGELGSKETLKKFLLESTYHREWVYHEDFRTAADSFASTISTILAQKKAKRDKCHDIIAGYLSDPASQSIRKRYRRTQLHQRTSVHVSVRPTFRWAYIHQ